VQALPAALDLDAPLGHPSFRGIRRHCILLVETFSPISQNTYPAKMLAKYVPHENHFH
jgi:hypothetical protein